MRKDVNRFSHENNRLAASVDELKGEVSNLQEKEQALAKIAETSQSTTQSLVELVRENNITLEEMKYVVRDDLVADLMDTVFKGERDQSGEFSDVEIQRLIRYMRGLPAVTINEELLRETIQKDRSILSLLTLVRDIGIDGMQQGDHIFMINDDNPELQTRFIEVP